MIVFFFPFFSVDLFTNGQDWAAEWELWSGAQLLYDHTQAFAQFGGTNSGNCALSAFVLIFNCYLPLHLSVFPFKLPFSFVCFTAFAAWNNWFIFFRFFPFSHQMMADITFRQGDFEGALNLYNELLTRDPSKPMLCLFSVQFDTRRQWLVFTLDAHCIPNCHVALRLGIFPSTLFPLAAYYLAMMRFIEAARRCGKLTLVPSILEQAEKHSNRAKYESGLFFCKGLYEWHTGLCSVLGAA